ncbi:hypothetical protein [Tychonema sp. LEGE 07203]|nr:hypothetical protein [Tychonema sp. LEGE 07203]MBE9095061.1 hypothetical protein [Tychonema sp. LEGE 07203]
MESAKMLLPQLLWNSVKFERVRAEGGTRHREGDDTNPTHKSLQSGGGN